MIDYQEADANDLLTKALEHAPDVSAPSDFARRVMARVSHEQPHPALHRARALTPRYGRAAAYGALVITAIAVIVLTFHVRPSASWYASQMVLMAQLGCIAVWIGLASWRSQ